METFQSFNHNVGLLQYYKTLLVRVELTFHSNLFEEI
jgi:hypothetical protein